MICRVGSGPKKGSLCASTTGIWMVCAKATAKAMHAASSTTQWLGLEYQGEVLVAFDEKSVPKIRSQGQRA